MRKRKFLFLDSMIKLKYKIPTYFLVGITNLRYKTKGKRRENRLNKRLLIHIKQKILFKITKYKRTNKNVRW